MWDVSDDEDATGTTITTTTGYSQYSWCEGGNATGEWVCSGPVAPEGVTGAPGEQGHPGAEPEPERRGFGRLNLPIFRLARKRQT